MRDLSQTYDYTSNIKLRFLCPSDIDVVKHLCKEWFPIKYPDKWYEEVTSSTKFYSVVATVNDEVVGLIVSEIKPYVNCNYEDQGLLCKGLEESSRVAYILTLGVVRHMRRHGIATILLRKLIESLTTNPLLEDCKAIYLHVLTTNQVAICFYEKLHFKRYKFLPLYYSINSNACDGYSYVLYLNGGRPPFSLIHCLSSLFQAKRAFYPCLSKPSHWITSGRGWAFHTSLALVPYKWLKKSIQNVLCSLCRRFSYSKVNNLSYLNAC